MRHALVWAAVFVIACASGTSALTLTDNFDDNDLDPTLWYTTDNTAVTESGGLLHLTGRHYLVTQDETTVGALQTVRLVATFTTEDQISVTFRTDGIRQPADYNRPLNGIYVTVWYDAVIAIDRFINGTHVVTGRYDSSAGDIPGIGDTFLLEVTDDGAETVVRVDDVEMLRVPDATAYGTNKISFANSGWPNSETTVDWIDISSETVAVSPKTWAATKNDYR